MEDILNRPDVLQGYSREWPITEYTETIRKVLAPEPPFETSCCIAYLGGCTLSGGAIGGLGLVRDGELCPTQFNLAVRLHRDFPDQLFVIRNFGEAGVSAGQFLSGGHVDRVQGILPRLDIVFLRFGIADRKQEGVPKTVENVHRLCRQFKKAFPRVMIIIETDMWVDYPEHYLFDRNPHLAPLYHRLRNLAASEGYAVVDIFARMEEETQKGNWDLRVRAVPVEGVDGIADGSFDKLFGDDPAFFTDIHPNARCFGLIAEWEVETLRELFGDRLPNT